MFVLEHFGHQQYQAIKTLTLEYNIKWSNLVVEGRRMREVYRLQAKVK